ncbi:hypothetical protein ACH5RR_030358 [Cinchona calisaya]|uniref:Aminotransferase-like plant mobile domain-containing protein n=1 Tax=Cinchona calisaya TaxID=153742 RepID=A0ABD2YUD2_9GENT
MGMGEVSYMRPTGRNTNPFATFGLPRVYLDAIHGRGIGDITAYCIAGQHVWRSRCPLICWEIVEFHMPHRVMMQFEMQQGIPYFIDTDVRFTGRHVLVMAVLIGSNGMYITFFCRLIVQLRLRRAWRLNAL